MKPATPPAPRVRECWPRESLRAEPSAAARKELGDQSLRPTPRLNSNRWRGRGAARRGSLRSPGARGFSARAIVTGRERRTMRGDTRCDASTPASRLAEALEKIRAGHSPAGWPGRHAPASPRRATLAPAARPGSGQRRQRWQRRVNCRMLKIDTHAHTCRHGRTARKYTTTIPVIPMATKAARGSQGRQVFREIWTKTWTAGGLETTPGSAAGAG